MGEREKKKSCNKGMGKGGVFEKRIYIILIETLHTQNVCVGANFI